MVTSAASRKELGAYYTDSRVAAFLAQWAIRSGTDLVLDPSFGGGVFLAAAADRIRCLGGNPVIQVYGIELDENAHQAFARGASADYSATHLVRADFFQVEPPRPPQFDAVIGNPPFIRYQRFAGGARRIALDRAADAGVRLSQLTSSWAPFLVHAAQFVKPGGRLGMVAPAELAHAAYARPVLEFLRRSFASTRMLTFARKLFPALSQDTVLILASGKDEARGSVSVVDLEGVQALDELVDGAAELPAGHTVNSLAVEQGVERFAWYLLPAATRALYAELRASPSVAPLGALGSVGIGYVTGCNDFFHVSAETAERYGLRESLLAPSVTTGRDLSGLRYTVEDWRRLRRAGAANCLLRLDGGEHDENVRRYLDQGIRRGVDRRFKCRTRTPWYSVPHVHQAQGFLSYMSGSAPRFAANAANAVASNAVHVVRLQPLSAWPLDAVQLAVLWQSGITALSCEVEGHSLGGGMLKMEPTEAERVLVAVQAWDAEGAPDLHDELDSLLRSGRAEAAGQLVDDAVLKAGLGLSSKDVSRLREGAQLLRSRRLRR